MRRVEREQLGAGAKARAGSARKAELARSVQRSLRQFDAELDVLEQVVAAHLGLSRTDGRALEIIDRRHGVTPGELARDLGYTPSAVTVVINRLEAAGLAERSLSESDRRRLAIHPTEAGRNLVRGFFTDLGARIDCILQAMSEDELAAIDRFLRDLGSLAADYRGHVRSIDQA